MNALRVARRTIPTIAFAVACGAAWASSVVYVKADGGSVPDDWVKSVGKVETRKGDTYTIRVKNGLDELKAIRTLRRLGKFEAVWSDAFPAVPEQYDLFSVKRIKEKIEELGGGHEREKEEEREREEQGKPKKGLGEQEEEHGTDYLEALLHFTRIRSFPYDQIDYDAYDVAAAKAKKMKKAKFPAPGQRGLSSMWQFIGPRDLDVPYVTYYGVRPTSGRVNSIAYAPSAPSTVYLGGASGGVWKSINGGVTWTVTSSDSWEFLHVSTLAVDPMNPQIVYAGTGDWHGSVGYGMGVMKSLDGGATWTNYGRNEMGGNAVAKIIVDPDTPSTLIAVTGRGRDYNGRVFRSTDGGKNWSATLNVSAPWSDASLSGKDGSGKRALYVVGGGTGGNVYRSDDKGATWTKLTPGINSGSHGNLAVAASPGNASNVYLLSPLDEKIYKSTDKGANWTDTTGSFPGGYNWSQAWYDFHITAGTVSGTDVVYVGLIDIVKSSDAGSTWVSIGNTYTGSAITHNDQHCLAVNPTNANEAIFGNDGGVYKASGTTITPLSLSLGITQFYHADWHPTDITRMVGGTQDNASPVAIGDLAHWSNKGGGDGGGSAINWAQPNIQYCTVYGLTVIQTKDNWATQNDISPSVAAGEPTPFVTPIYQDPTDGDSLYAASNYLYRYSVSKNSWTNHVGGQRLSSNGLVLCMAVAPGNGQYIYTGSDDGEVWVSRNHGTSWTKISTGLPTRAVTSISVSPANPNDILVGLSGTGSGHLYRCADTSATSRVWKNVSAGLPDIPLNCIERDPFTPTSRWYVGTDIGVFSSDDSGTTWANATSGLGLPNVQITDLKAIKQTGYLNASTYGRGIWRVRFGREVDLQPVAYRVVEGQETSGSLASLLTTDADKLVLSSENAGTLGQVAAVVTDFQLPSTNGLSSLEFSAVISGSVPNSTFQVYVKNQITGKFTFLKAYPTKTSVVTATIPISNATAYASASGLVQVELRILRAPRFGQTPISLSVDKISAKARITD